MRHFLATQCVHQ